MSRRFSELIPPSTVKSKHHELGNERQLEKSLSELQVTIKKYIDSQNQQFGDSKEDADFGENNYDVYNSSRMKDVLAVQTDPFNAAVVPESVAGPIRRQTLQESLQGRSLLSGHIMASPSSDNSKVCVYVKLVFLRIGRVETSKETFQAEVFMQARWRDTTLDGRNVQPDDVNWGDTWLPLLYLENTIGDVTQKTWRTVVYAGSAAHVVERRRVSAHFAENMELAEFPFDSQHLNVMLVSERPPAEIDVVIDDVDMDELDTHGFVAQEEWKLHRSVGMRKKRFKTEFCRESDRRVAMALSCVVSRKPGFFVWNIIVFMMLICTMTFVTFSVEHTRPENRLLLAFFLLLATITFKLFVSASLPKVPYLTSLDRYIIMSMTIMFCTCLWHGVITVVNSLSSLDDDTVELLDRVACGALGLLFIGFQVIFFAFIADRANKQYKRRLREIFSLD